MNAWIPTIDGSIDTAAIDTAAIDTATIDTAVIDTAAIDTATIETVADPNALVEEHIWLVDRLAANLARRFPRHIDRSQLHSAGLLGLVEASRRFDPSQGVAFASFASARVRGEMIESVRERDLAPRRQRRAIREITQAGEALGQALGRPATPAEIADSLGIDEFTVNRRLADAVAYSDARSLEHEVANGAEPVSIDADPVLALEEDELIGAVRQAVVHLPDPLRDIVLRSFWGNERLCDIAADMGVSLQRIAQYRSEAMDALSAWFSTMYDDVEPPNERNPGQARRAAFCATLAGQSTYRTRLASAKVELAAPSPAPRPTATLRAA